MKEYTLSQQFAIVGLDALDSIHMPLSKRAVIKGIGMAELLEEIFLPEGSSLSDFSSKFKDGIIKFKKIGKKEMQKIEKNTVQLLMKDGTVNEVQDLLACDLYYETAGLGIRQYRSKSEEYVKITESVRAEILEEGEISKECICLLWLFRETGIMHEIFTIKEQSKVKTRLIKIENDNEINRILMESEFHSSLQFFSLKYLLSKKNLFKNPYMEGVNLVFPFLERRNAIFIEFVIYATNVAERRALVKDYLEKRGHFVEELKNGEETLLKIDNTYYRIIPGTRYAKLPIQGVNIVPMYQ